jgi:hypothetical protein
MGTDAYDPLMPWLELIGWAGSALLVWSLAQARVLRFRIFNLIASLILIGYNAAIGVWPMVAMNAAIVVINVFHLVKLVRTRDDARTYEVVEVGPDDDYLRYVLRRHGPDIERHNPGFAWEGSRPGCEAFLVLRETETVGVVLMRRSETDPATAEVVLDYVVPRFRDFSVGKFVYRPGGVLAGRGLRRAVAPLHRMTDARTYFPKVGFRADPDDSDTLVLDIARPAG